LTRYIELEVFVLEIEAIGYKVKDYGLLGAALARPRTTAFGKDAYQTLELKAAALVHSMIQNHPMLDGNKRVAWLALNTFLYLNGFLLKSNKANSYKLILGIPKDQFALHEIEEWVKTHLVKITTS